MRKLILSLVCCTALAACTTTGQVEDKIKEVQNYTRLACSFLPTVETVAKILAGGTVIDTASAVGNAICNAVTTAPLADGPGDRVPRVNGVVIKGRFVK